MDSVAPNRHSVVYTIEGSKMRFVCLSGVTQMSFLHLLNVEHCAAGLLGESSIFFIININIFSLHCGNVCGHSHNELTLRIQTFKWLRVNIETI